MFKVASLYRPEIWGLLLILSAAHIFCLANLLTGKGTPSFAKADLLITLALGILGFSLVSGTMLNRLTRLKKILRASAQGIPVHQTISGTDEIAKIGSLSQMITVQRDEAIMRELAIADYANELICCLDMQKQFAAIGFAVQDMLGYDEVDLIERSLDEILLESDIPRFNTAITDARTHQSPSTLACRLKHKRSGTVDVNWQIEWSDTEQLFFCILEDITERKNLERMKERFFSMISHDIRTPLTTMQASLAFVTSGAAGEVPDVARNNLTTAEESVESLIKLIADLLDFEKMEHGEVVLDLDWISIEELCTRIERTWAPLAKANNVALVIEPSESIVSADFEKLIRVLNNYVSNALKFAPSGSQIVLRSREAHEYVEISVADTGPGVPEEMHSLIFESFKQASPAHTGSGLGLAICKSIIESHGGKVGYTPGESGGSIFWLRIPRTMPPTD